LVGLLAFAGLTACGDKVTVPPVTTTPVSNVVHGVTVSPSSASLAIGDKFQFGASVDADQGVTDRTVTWSSANAAVATVDATGLVTAVSGGTTSITAKSKADPTVSGSASVTVQAVVVATVTIGQINQTVCAPGGGSCSSVPAVLTNVANQLDVTLNVDQGTQKVTQVQLLMNCGGTDTVVQTQSFAIAPPGGADAAAAPVTLSFNTAAFNASTGAVSFKNGTCTLKAKAITSTGTQSAVSSTQLTLNNVDILTVSPLTTTPTGAQKASATDANGLTWNAGAVNVTVVPVLYSANTVGTIQVTLVNRGNDAAIGRGQVATVLAAGGALATLSPTVPATGGAITMSFPNDSTTGTAAGVGGAVVDTLSVAATTVFAAGNTGPSLAASAAPGAFIRLDNRAPEIGVGAGNAPGFGRNTQLTANGWTGSAFVFSVGTDTTVKPLNIGVSSTDNMSAVATAPGVGKVATSTQKAPNGASAGSSTWATFTSVTTLAETQTSTGSTSYDLRLVICDALNNCATTATLGSFGVDLTAPTILANTGPKDKEIVGLTQFLSATSVGVSPNDPQGANGVIGSGFGPKPLLASETRLFPSGSSGQQTQCVAGIGVPNSGNTACSGPSAQTNPFAVGTTVPGQYLLSYVLIDQAGNMSAPVTVNYYLDQAAPAMTGGISIPANITNGAVFTASGTDDMDFASVNAVIAYPGANLQIAGVSSATGVAFDNTLTRASTATITLSNFFRSLGGFDAAGAINVAQAKPTQIGIRGVDAASNLSAPDVGVFPANNIANFTNLSGTTLGFTLASDVPSVCNATGNCASASAPRSANLTATVNALNPQAATPFAQVCFYVTNPSGASGSLSDPVSNGAAGELFLIGCTSVQNTQAGGPGGKVIVSTIPFDPNALYGTAGSLSIVAIGVTANGDAMLAAASVALGLTP
jgi:hypothetical protein